MEFVIYTVLLLFLFACELTVGYNDFFESSQSENRLDPSKDFFGEYEAHENDFPEVKSDGSQSISTNDPEKRYNIKEDLRYKAYITRFFNILLRAAGFTEDSFEDDSKTIRVYLTLTKKDFAALNNLEIDEEMSLERSENILRSMFNSNVNTKLTNVFLEYLHYPMMLLLAAIVLWFVFIIQKINFNMTKASFIFIAFIALVLNDLMKQYEELSEKKVLKRMEFENHSSPPKECFYSKMSFFEKITVFLTRDDPCKRFLESRTSVFHEMDYVSSFIKPLQAIFSSLSSMFGEGFEKIMKPFIERSPWPINVLLEFIVAVYQIPVLIFIIILIVFLFTSRTVSLKLPLFGLSMTSYTNHVINGDHTTKISQEEVASQTSKSSIQNYLVNKGGIVVLGNEDKLLQSYSMQGTSSRNLNNPLYSFKISQQNNESLINERNVNSEDKKSGSIFNEHFPTNKKKKDAKWLCKKSANTRKMNFKPYQRYTTVKVPLEN